jgi:hypothetical protein
LKSSFNSQNTLILGILDTFGILGIILGTQEITKKQIGQFNRIGSDLSGWDRGNK